jgi:hypothetical protein
MLGCLRYQTRKPDRVIVLCSDTPLAELREDFADVEFHEAPNMNDWGHAKRAEGIRLASGDYMGFFNDDDSYELNYLERMLDTVTETDADVVWCAWNEQPDCEFRSLKSTAGNFVVSVGLAKELGWKDRHYEADGAFIDSLVASGAVCVKVDDRDPVLYHHNV